MAVFPNYVSGLNDSESSKFILKKMEDNWEQYSRMNLAYQSQADIDMRFYCGDQTVFSDMYGWNQPHMRQNFSFNLLRRLVQMPSGFQRENRKSTIAIPIEGSDQRTADQFTKILMWNDQQDSVLDTISYAFTGALVTGMNLLQIWPDYSNDPLSGDIRIGNCSYNSFILDPFFKRPDLSDCNFVWKRSFVTLEQAVALLPGHAEELESIGISSSTDGKFTYMPETRFSDSNKLLTYDEYYYRSYRKATFIVDHQKGKKIEWAGEDDDLRELLRTYTYIDVLKNTIPTVRQAIVVQGRVIFNGANTMGTDTYPFVPVLGYYSPELDSYDLRIQGLVRNLRDAQFLFNRRKQIELDILESQPNSGWIAEEDSVANPKSLFKTGQGQVIWKKKGAPAPEKIQPANISPSMFEASKNMMDLLQAISGENEELLGSAVDDKAGILSMLRQGAGLRTLRSLFDQLDNSQKLLGRRRIEIIQRNFTPGKIERIINEQPSQEFYNRDFGTYDCAIEEGFNTTTQRQLQYAQLLNLKEAGYNIPASFLIKAATLQNKDELIQAISQADQAQAQQAQEQAQVQMQEQQATVNMANAQAAYQQAGAQERISRIQENQALAVERQAEAQKDEEQAVLNKIKALKELQEIDLTQIQKLLEIAQQIESIGKTVSQPQQ